MPKQLTDTAFRVHVATNTGANVSKASVTLNLVMPSMPMPPNNVPCRETAPGNYTGVGTFTMPGDWRVDATARLPSGATVTGSRPVHVR